MNFAPVIRGKETGNSLYKQLQLEGMMHQQKHSAFY